jgi:hypothetical protein
VALNKLESNSWGTWVGTWVRIVDQRSRPRRFFWIVEQKNPFGHLSSYQEASPMATPHPWTWHWEDFEKTVIFITKWPWL